MKKMREINEVPLWSCIVVYCSTRQEITKIGYLLSGSFSSDRGFESRPDLCWLLANPSVV